MSNTSEPKLIRIEEIRENPVALRAVNLESEEYIGLRDAIRAVGILNPISVRRQTTVVDGNEISFYELIDGLHRYSAAKECGLVEIPVNIISLDDAATKEAQILANLHSVKTKAVDFVRGMGRIFAGNPTLTVSDMAAKVCKSPSWVSQQFNLLKLEVVIQKLVNDGKINISNAIALSKLPPAEQVNYVDQAVSMSSEEFVPVVQARAKEIKDQARKGRAAGPVEFVPIPRLQKMNVLKDELTTPKIGPALVKQCKTKNVADAFNLGVAWTLSMDPTSVEVRKAADVAKKKSLADDKKKREAERAEKKAQAAQKIAVETAEAVAGIS